MKSFIQFIKEAATSPATQAARLGLKGDSHGGWYKDGEFVAKTEKGRLKFYNKNQRPGKILIKDLMAPKATPQQAAPAAKAEPADAPAEPQGDFGTFADALPTNADGSPKEDRGEVTLTFGRFNVPTTGHEKLFQQAQKAAGKGDLRIYPSRSVDAKKNPLNLMRKIESDAKDVPRLFQEHCQ